MFARIRAMRLIFGMAGIGISVWALTIPFAKIRFGVDDATLGMMLFASGIGGVLTMPLAGGAVARLGGRKVVALTGLVLAVLLPVLAVAPSVLSFTALVFVYGMAFGVLDVAMNAQGSVVQAQAGRRLMSGFHACYSGGTLAVALLDALLLRLGVSYALCSTLAALAVLAALTQLRHLPAGPVTAGGPGFALPSRATLLLGACCFVCFFSEGAATDWSAVFLHFSRGMSLANATLGYAGFAVAVVGVRVWGDALAAKLGPVTVMRLGSALSAVGLLVAACVNQGWVDIAGFFLVGLGLGNTVPLLLSAAARVPGEAPHHATAAVLALGYAGFLAGPVLIGALADHFGLGPVLALNALGVAALLPAARALTQASSGPES